MMAMGFDQWDKLRAVDAGRRPDDNARAFAAARRILSWLQRHPILQRYLAEWTSTPQFRCSQPWHAYGDMLSAASLATSTFIGDAEIQRRVQWEMDLSPRQQVGLALSLATMTVPYLWTNKVSDLVRYSPPLPRHVVSRTVLPYPLCFFSYEMAYVSPEGDCETNWLFLQDDGDHMNVLADSLRPNDRVITIAGGSIDYGATFPDDFGSAENRAAAEKVLKILAFIASPIAVTRAERMPRPIRRELQQGRRERTDPPTTIDPLVQVVVLRRALENGPRPERPEGISEVDWRHHWWVSGHWRAQWYPKEQTHRLTYISPYVKGDLAKPLLEKVYSVAR